MVPRGGAGRLRHVRSRGPPRHVAGAAALPPGAAPGGRLGPRRPPGAWLRVRPRLGPAAGSGAGPQDAARPPRQVQGVAAEGAAARRPRGAAGDLGAVPAAPAGPQRPPGRVPGRGAAEEAGGAAVPGGLGGADGAAPAPHGLERGRERPAAGPQRGKNCKRSGRRAEAEAKGCGEQGQYHGGFPEREGEGSSPAAGGSQNLHHPRELGRADRAVPGQPSQLQLCHRQGRARRQTDGVGLAAPARHGGCWPWFLSTSSSLKRFLFFFLIYKSTTDLVEKSRRSGCGSSEALNACRREGEGETWAEAEKLLVFVCWSQ